MKNILITSIILIFITVLFICVKLNNYDTTSINEASKITVKEINENTPGYLTIYNPPKMKASHKQIILIKGLQQTPWPPIKSPKEELKNFIK